MTTSNPTQRTYKTLDDAYRFFNARLFNGGLPPCLLTMQRSRKAYGYFAGGRFGTRDGTEVTDEIALNPSYFRARTTTQSLSTLVHEMTHLQQHHFGKPSRVVASHRLAQAVALDMTQWWTADAGFLARLPKSAILGVIAEAASPQTARSLDRGSKADIVAAGERMLAGTNWLPEIFRRPAPASDGDTAACQANASQT